MRGFFVWCFNELGVWRLQIATTRDNRSIKRGAPKMGFKFEGVARDYYGIGVDALRYSMTADQCRWLNGITIQQSEAA
jgi:RimJ/RimL family protein N-acetyltransferase